MTTKTKNDDNFESTSTSCVFEENGGCKIWHGRGKIKITAPPTRKMSFDLALTFFGNSAIPSSLRYFMKKFSSIAARILLGVVCFLYIVFFG